MTNEIRLIGFFFKDSREVDAIDPTDCDFRIIRKFAAMSLAGNFSNTSTFRVRYTTALALPRGPSSKIFARVDALKFIEPGRFSIRDLQGRSAPLRRAILTTCESRPVALPCGQ